MKYSKTLFLPFIALLATSCGQQNYSGVYAFQLGKEESTHIAISLNLTEEDYSDPELGKKLAFTFDLSGVGEDTEMIDPTILDLIKSFVDLDVDGTKLTLHGFYSIGEAIDNKERKLNVGISLVSETGENEKGEEETSQFVIPTEMVDDLVFATIKPDQAVFNIPTSLNDLTYQLYWYGYDINFSEFEFTEVTPHQHGTHPTTEDIEYINNTLNYAKTHGDKPYRDFHQLSMALNKK